MDKWLQIIFLFIHLFSSVVDQDYISTPIPIPASSTKVSIAPKGCFTVVVLLEVVLRRSTRSGILYRNESK